jgi:hypothetical protein
MSLMVSLCISSMASHVEDLLICFLDVHVSSLVNLMFILYLSCLSHVSCLCIMDTNSLSDR